MKKILSFVVDHTLVKVSNYVASKINTPVKSENKPNVYKYLWEKAIIESASYIEPKLNEVMLFKNRKQIWDFTLSKVNTEGLFIEFGVFQGTSINYFSSKLTNHHFYGFDSFEGLAEDWIGHHAAKGTFNLHGKLPEVNTNVTLFKGWFEESIPHFLNNNNEFISFIHVDADTYDATKTIFDLMGSRIRKGTIILFDEYIGYPNWKNGEYLAWKEFVDKNDITYRYLGFSNEQAVIEIY